MLFYADENFPLNVIVELRRLGHDVLTAYEDGRTNQEIVMSDERLKVFCFSAESEEILKWKR